MRPLALLVVVVVAAAAAPARAEGICIEPDAERDMLTGDDRLAAVQTLQATLAAAGKPLGPPCSETWQLSHTRLGTSLQVLLVTPGGAITGAAGSLEQLPTAYEDMVERLYPPPARPRHPVDRDDAPTRPERRRPAALPTHGDLYLRVGYAIAPATSSDIQTRTGPLFAVGYRRIVAENLLLDLAFFETHIFGEPISPDYGASVLSFIRIAGYWTHPLSPATALYVGGGASFGQLAVTYINPPDQTTPPTPGDNHGYALQLEPAAGIEFFRDRENHLFFHAAIVLPLDTIAIQQYAPLTTTYYVPTFSISAGFTI